MADMQRVLLSESYYSELIITDRLPDSFSKSVLNSVFVRSDPDSNL